MSCNDIKSLTKLVKDYWDNLTPEELEEVLKKHRQALIECNKTFELLDKPPTTEFLNRTYNL